MRAAIIFSGRPKPRSKEKELVINLSSKITILSSYSTLLILNVQAYRKDSITV